MKKYLLLAISAFVSSVTFAQNPECVEIFMSEYVEGWSNNKAIELYNPTDQEIDLSNYRLERYSNGSTSADATKRIDLAGIMPPLSVYVIVIDKRDSLGTGQEAPVWDELQAKADTFLCPVYEDNNVMYFNGNDAMVLKNTSGSSAYTVDAIGRVGEDPGVEGWNDVGPDYTFASNGATGWTQDHSLIRKSTVLLGDLYPADVFDVSLEWDSIPPTLYDAEGNIIGGNWGSLGEHYCECGDAVNSVNEIVQFKLTISPNPASDFFTIQSEKSILSAIVYGMNGEKIFSTTTNTQNLRIESDGWSKGYYLVNLQFENGYVLSRKVLIQ